jgi:hypothetical protein
MREGRNLPPVEAQLPLMNPTQIQTEPITRGRLSLRRKPKERTLLLGTLEDCRFASTASSILAVQSPEPRKAD